MGIRCIFFGVMSIRGYDELVCSEWHWSSCGECEEFGGGVSCEIGFVQEMGRVLCVACFFLCHFVLVGGLCGLRCD